jgi:hypothetical protein
MTSDNAVTCCFCGDSIDADKSRVKQVAGDPECVGSVAHPNCLLGEPIGVNDWVFEEAARAKTGLTTAAS